jgi:hypothetical protein
MAMRPGRVLGGVLVAVIGLECGCLNVRAPDVYVNAGGGGGSSDTGPRERKLPYADALDKVLSKAADVEKQLQKRDWEEFGEDVGDWAKAIRRLNGEARSSAEPAKMQQYCAELLRCADRARRAGRAKDAAGAGRALDQAQPWLNRLSAEFPMTEPVAESERAAAP